MKINPGRYFAKVVDYGFVESQAGNLLVFVVFSFKDGEQVCHLTWYGSFNEGKAREITLKALALLSQKVQRGHELVPSIVAYGIDAMADGKASKMLDVVNEVSIDVDLETNKNTGKTYPRIKWINPASGNQQRLMTRDDVKVKVAGMQLGADLLLIGQQTAIKHVPTASMADDQIPF